MIEEVWLFGSIGVLALVALGALFWYISERW